MPRVLVTGMSATGKSTVLAELGRRGWRTVDTDEPGWIVAAPDGEPLWDEPRMAALLAEEAGRPLAVAGCVMNQGRFYDRFDAVVLLSAPVDVIVERLETRTTNAFGKTAEERERILGDIAELEPALRRGATCEIDTSGPLAAVVDQVIAAARE